jgi:release factor glutamine methyltransferase
LSFVLKSRKFAVSIFEALKKGREKLRESGLENADEESRYLLSGLLNCSLTDLQLRMVDSLPEGLYEKYLECLERRSLREPLAYILGKKNFWGRDFYVDKNVLIPRPETELLVEKISAVVKESNNTRILDIGTGSGCIAVTLALQNPGISIVATDVSENALFVAEKNARNFNVHEKISFIKSDLFESFPMGMEHFDIIVSNPPYIDSVILKGLASELGFEPQSALDGGVKGLDILRTLIQKSSQHLNNKGKIFLEIGFDQAKEVAAIFQQSNFKNIEIWKDFGGNDRIVKGEWSGSI